MSTQARRRSPAPAAASSTAAASRGSRLRTRLAGLVRTRWSGINRRTRGALRKAESIRKVALIGATLCLPLIYLYWRAIFGSAQTGSVFLYSLFGAWIGYEGLLLVLSLLAVQRFLRNRDADGLQLTRISETEAEAEAGDAKARRRARKQRRRAGCGSFPAPPQVVRWDFIGVLLSNWFGKVMNWPLPKFLRPTVLGLFAKAVKANPAEAKYPLVHFRSIQEFFTRELRPGLRPVCPKTDVVSPVDGRVVVCGEVTGDQVEQVKGASYSLTGFLGQGWERQRASRTSKLFHCVIYLAPGDYHRIHSPAHFSVGRLRHFPGTLFPISPLVARLVPNLFSLNERVVLSGRWLGGDLAADADTDGLSELPSPAGSVDRDLDAEEEEASATEAVDEEYEDDDEEELEEEEEEEDDDDEEEEEEDGEELAGGRSRVRRRHVSSPSSSAGEAADDEEGSSGSDSGASRSGALSPASDASPQPQGCFFSVTAVGAYNVGSIEVSFDASVRTNSFRRTGLRNPNIDFLSMRSIGSFAYDREYPVRQVVLDKGQELGTFKLGSTVVLVFEVPVDSDFVFHVQPGQKVTMGEPLGSLKAN